MPVDTPALELLIKTTNGVAEQYFMRANVERATPNIGHTTMNEEALRSTARLLKSNADVMQDMVRIITQCEAQIVEQGTLINRARSALHRLSTASLRVLFIFWLLGLRDRLRLARDSMGENRSR